MQLKYNCNLSLSFKSNFQRVDQRPSVSVPFFRYSSTIIYPSYPPVHEGDSSG